MPLRPLCELLGLDWSAQYRRLNRDLVLSEVLIPCVVVTATQGQPDQRREMICLPLDFINGFLFGINASRVKEELRERVLRYQRECYRVLADTFVNAPLSTSMSTLMQVREMGRAIMRMAEEQMAFEQRLTDTENHLEQTVNLVGDMGKRLSLVEQRVAPGQPITEAQASQISQAVKAVALLMGKKTKRNEFGGVYGELYRRYGITSYKQLPTEKFEGAMKWLTEWHESLHSESF